MNKKLINLGLILTSLFGYLEWGGGNSVFLMQAESEIVAKMFNNPMSAAHPFTVLPLLGQILLLATLFQKQPNKIISLVAIAGIGLLLGFMCFIGALSLNPKIFFSTVPFLTLAVYAVREYRKKGR